MNLASYVKPCAADAMGMEPCRAGCVSLTGQGCCVHDRMGCALRVVVWLVCLACGAARQGMMLGQHEAAQALHCLWG